MESPRCIKSHLPIQLLPDQIWTKNPKMIYVKRNLKDTVVSNYHLDNQLKDFQGTMDEYVEAFMADYIDCSPYFPHIENYTLASKKLENLMILNYEDMKKDLGAVIRLVANFLDKSINNVELQKLCEHLSIENMKSECIISSACKI